MVGFKPATASHKSNVLTITPPSHPMNVVNVGFEYFFFQLDFFLSLRYCHLLLLLTLFLRAPVSGGCILPWCPVQCLLHLWTNKLIDWSIDLYKFCSLVEFILCCVAFIECNAIEYVEYVDLYAEETHGSHAFGVIISQTAERPQVKSMLNVGS